MKILLMRHGEAMDDVMKTYGGWADDPLTDKGRQEILAKADSIQNLNIKFNKILTSPLKRANETGKILGNLIKLPVEKLEYAAEFNGYGILSGMKKDDANVKYPDLVKLLLETKELLVSIEKLIDSEIIKILKVLGAESVYSLAQR